MNFKGLKELKLIKTIVNVYILPGQVLKIDGLVKKGEYKSINKFVQEAVRDKLNPKARRKLQ